MKTYLQFKDFKTQDEIVVAKEDIIAIRQMQLENHVKIFMQGGASFDINCRMKTLVGYLKGASQHVDE